MNIKQITKVKDSWKLKITSENWKVKGRQFQMNLRKSLLRSKLLLKNMKLLRLSLKMPDIELKLLKEKRVLWLKSLKNKEKVYPK